MKDQSFDLKNIALLARADFACNRRGILIALTVLMLVICLNYLNAVVAYDSLGMEYAKFLKAKGINDLILLIFMVILTSSAFNTYYNKKGMTKFNMNIPASKVEKFTYLATKNIVVLPLLFFFINSAILYILSLIYGFNAFVKPISAYLNIGAVWFCVLSYLFLISVCFRKSQLAIGMLIYGVSSAVIMFVFFKNETGYSLIVNLSDIWNKSVFGYLGLGCAMLFIAAAWYKFSRRLQIK